MASQRSATISIRNDTGGNASILLFHNNSSNGTQRGSWFAAPGDTAGPLTVYFKTGLGTEAILDYWSVLVHVRDGPGAGFYVSSGGDLRRYWKECQLQRADADQSITLSVSTTVFDVALRSGGCTDGMTRLAPAAPITHVFVVMLENHSFDNMLAMSGISGIKAATTQDANSYQGKAYHVQASAPLSMPSDPGHEFTDVLEQLGGEGACYPPGGPYPAIDNSGFAANYATSDSETTKAAPAPPPAKDIGDIMACFATPDQLPVLWQLATEFAVCDRWHCSLPGPTWPNRFFLHGASSSGLDHSPSNAEIAKWETIDGFQYPNGSIFHALGGAQIPCRFYNDTTGAPREESLFSDRPQDGSPVGAVPQVAALKGVSFLDFHSLRQLSSDLQGPYPYPYTFIEPHYGDILSDTYTGGSSQHPLDDVYGGEHLLAAVYSAIRNSPYWETSLLIVTYDEHGGFYDSVPPGPATPPGDDPQYGYNRYGFTFDTYGVRVPAVIVSPLIPRGTVDHCLYDHASVAKTLEQLWGLDPLTHRDAKANDVLDLLSLGAPRDDAPLTLQIPPPPLAAARPHVTIEERARIDALPLPDEGNLLGTLWALMKTDLELSAGTPLDAAAVRARVEAIETRGHARAYVASVMEKVGIAREQRRLAGERRL
ncbi:MAG TPA: alkaline phosphatase family protein [Allosphingosinicella sp.]